MDTTLEWQKILDSNWVEGEYKGRHFGYTRPSPDRGRAQQWLWDSCCHIIMLSKYRPDRAKLELDTLLAGQYPSGLVPMISYRAHEPLVWRGLDQWIWKRFLVKQPPGTVLTDPPLIAQAVQAVYVATKDREWLVGVLPKIKQFYKYLITQRDPDHDGLVSIIHPLESGSDMLPEFDEIIYGGAGRLPFYRFVRNWFLNHKISKHHDTPKVFEYFDCEQAMFNSIYALNLLVLADLLDQLHDPEADYFRKAGADAEEMIFEKMWDKDKGAFVSLYSKDERRTTRLTISSLMPLILPHINQEHLEPLVNHLKNAKEYNLKYNVPSVAASEPSFFAGDSIYLWQGGTWMITNWYIYHGLKRHGYDDLAAELARKSHDLIKQSGFREYYNPITGEGYRAKNYSWSTLAYDME